MNVKPLRDIACVLHITRDLGNIVQLSNAKKYSAYLDFPDALMIEVHTYANSQIPIHSRWYRLTAVT